MLTRAGVAFGVVLLIGVVTLGAWQHSSPERAQAVEQWFLYGPAPRGSCVEYTSSVTLDPIAQTCTVGGAPVAVSWGSYAQTQIDDGFAASGTVRIYAPADMPTGFGVPAGIPTQEVELSIGSDTILIKNSGAEERDGVTYYQYDGVFLNADDPADIDWSFEIAGDDSWHEYNWEIRFVARLMSRCGDDPISSKTGVTHAKERQAEDAWAFSETDNIYVAFGTEDATYAPGDGYMPSTRLMIHTSLAFNSLYSGIAGDIDELLQITVNFNAVEIDAGLLDVEIEPATKYGSYTGNNPRLFGEGNTLTWDLPDGWPGTCKNANWGGGASAPRFYSFGGLSVRDMDGESLDDLLVTCPAVQVYDASAEAWQPVTQSLAAWRAASYTDTWGSFSWDADPPPDGAVRLLPDVSFYIDKESAREHKLDGFDTEEAVSGVSFAHDARIIIHGWPLDVDSREADPHMNDVVALTHHDSASIYGPVDDPALTVTDWQGYDGVVASPDVGGAFSVIDGPGRLAIILPSNYGDRLDAVPAMNFPVGIPGMPEIAFYHKAGIWRAYDGALCRDEETYHSEPAEATYCARGWPCLKIPLTLPDGTDECELTVVLDVLNHSSGHNHLSDSTRQTEATHAVAEASYEYTIRAVSGDNYVYLATPDHGTAVDPDLEQVVAIGIEGFHDGDWVIGEVEWALDPEGTGDTRLVKFFEHWRYADGGMSGVADSVAHYALMDTSEGNAGHDNTVETNTVRLFDFIMGAESGIDFTGAYPLGSYVSLLDGVTDAWRATMDHEAAESHLKDADDNVVKSLSATDLRPCTRQPTGALDCALRCGQYTTVAGLQYDWTAEKLTGGSMHGQRIDGGKLARNATGEQVWWQPADESEGWALHDTPESNSAGLWRAKSGAVYHGYDPAALLRDYGTGTSAGSVTSSGRWAAREYDYTTLATSSALGAPWLHWMAGGWLHIAVTIDGIVRYYWVEPFRPTPILREADAHPFGEEGGFQNPFITSYACGWLLVGATEEEGYMRLSRSERFGDTWEEVSGGTLVDDLRNGCVDISDGFLIACGWKEGSVLFRTTSGRSFTPEAIHHGGPDHSVICESDAVDGDAPRSQVRWRGGAIEAMVETATGANLYRSPDWGATWTQIKAPHIADGMRGGNLAFIDGELLACGTEEGEVRAETAYRDTRVPESWWWTGPTYLTVVETAIASAIEAVHGERWVATGEDGISLYRLRSPSAGFEKII